MEIALRTDEEFQQQYLSVSFPPDTEAVAIIPFKDQAVSDWVELSGERILVAGSRGRITVLGARDGEVLAEAVDRKSKRSGIVAFEEIGLVVLHRSHRLAVWTLPGLRQIATHEAIGRLGERWRMLPSDGSRAAAVDPAPGSESSEQETRRFPTNDTAFGLSGDRVFFPYSDTDRKVGGTRLERGYAVWAPGSGSLTFRVVDTLVGPFAGSFQFTTNFTSVSPSGRFALRPDISSLPFHRAGEPKTGASRETGGAVDIHRDLADDGVPRFGTQLELWDTTLGTKLRSIVVRFDDWIKDTSHLPEAMQEEHAVGFRNELYRIHRLLDEGEEASRLGGRSAWAARPRPTAHLASRLRRSGARR